MDEGKKRLESIDISDAVLILQGSNSPDVGFNAYCHFLAVVLVGGIKSPHQVAMAFCQSFWIAPEGSPADNPLFGHPPGYYQRFKEKIPQIAEAIFPPDFSEDVIHFWNKSHT